MADTLIYIDLPLMTHNWWVTKRLMKGLFVNPEGWPDNSPMWRSTMSSFKVIPLCHERLTSLDTTPSKQVYNLKSPTEMRGFLGMVEREYLRA